MTDDIMARPDGTGSRASTEPASGLGPSGFDPSRGVTREGARGRERAITAMARAMCDRVNGQGDFDAHIKQRRSGWEAQARAGFTAFAASFSDTEGIVALVQRLRDWDWLCSIPAAEQRVTFSTAADMIERLTSTPAS